MKRLEGVGTAAIYKGDPRLPENDIDTWYNGMLGKVEAPKKRAHLYGADAGLCARRNVLLEHNEWIPGEITPASAGYMAIGVALEDLLAGALKRHNRLIVQGTYLIDIPYLKIRGKIDLVAFDHREELCLIEVKSCGKLPTEPKHDHLAQIQTYCAVSGITNAYLTYMSREVRDAYGPRMAIRSFQVETGEAALHNRLRTAAMSMLASKEGKLPPVPATFRKHTECHYCSFRDHYCWFPRPGSRSSTDLPEGLDLPLPNLTVAELVAIDQRATAIADDLIENLLSRKHETLIKLLDEEMLEEGLETRLLEIKSSIFQELIN